MSTRETCPRLKFFVTCPSRAWGPLKSSLKSVETGPSQVKSNFRNVQIHPELIKTHPRCLKFLDTQDLFIFLLLSAVVSVFIFSHLYVCQTSRHTETLTDGQRVHLCAHVPGGQGSTASDVCTSDEQRVLMLHCTRRAARTSLSGPLLLPVPFKTQKNRPLTAH